MGGVVSTVVDAVVDVTVDIVVNIPGKIVEETGKVLDNQLGLDSIGKEVGRWGQDAQQVGNVLKGNYHEDLGAIND